MMGLVIGIVVPVHNEEEDIAACIRSIQMSIKQIDHLDIPVQTIFVVDSCTDQSLNIIQMHQQDFIECDYRCVGQARDLGVKALIERGVTWIASTDADSMVHRDWLQHQIDHQPTDVICGVVEIEKWGNLSVAIKHKYIQHYQDRMGHSHIHGANLAFCRDAYIRVGGFDAITCHEDVNLIEKFMANNYLITWSNKVRVVTSSRLHARAPQGFSDFLKTLNVE